MKKYLTNLWILCTMKKEKGQAMVEYGLIIALVAIVVIVAIAALGGNLQGIFNSIAGKLSSSTSST